MQYPLTAEMDLLPRMATLEVMKCIKQVIKEMVTLAWLPSVPCNFGDAVAADEWRTILLYCSYQYMG